MPLSPITSSSAASNVNASSSAEVNAFSSTKTNVNLPNPSFSASEPVNQVVSSAHSDSVKCGRRRGRPPMSEEQKKAKTLNKEAEKAAIKAAKAAANSQAKSTVINATGRGVPHGRPKKPGPA